MIKKVLNIIAIAQANTTEKIVFLLYFLPGLILRFLLATFSNHAGDQQSWKLFGRLFYDLSISPYVWQSQGPLNSFPIILFSFVNYTFQINAYALNFFFNLGFILGDLILILFVFLILNKIDHTERFRNTLTIWYSSLLIYISSIWGQSEQWMVAFGILSLYFFSKKKILYAAFFLAVSFSFKYFTVILLPFILLLTSRKYWFKTILYFFIFSMISFVIVFVLNLILFNDYSYFSYLIGRSETITGNFLPNTSSSFVGTGSSIWGQLYNLGYVPVNTLNSIKKYWYIIFLLFYLFYIISFVYFFQKNKIFTSGLSSKFIFITFCLIYSSLATVFLFLYPQSQIQRFLNIIIPLYFVYFGLDEDGSEKIILPILNILLIVGNDIFAPGKLFHLEGLNSFLISMIYIILFISQLLFFKFITIRRWIILLSASILWLPMIYFFGQSSLHFIFSLVNFILIMLVCLQLNIKLFIQLKEKYVKI
jgi:hypothetical protein